MALAYLGIGTNLGNKELNIRQAIELIEEQAGKVVRVSSFYQSKPWGFVSEHNFINIALAVETGLLPEQLLETTQEIERAMGRTSKTNGSTYADRIIDIDLLFYDEAVIDSYKLKIPHPLLPERDFVVIPLAEIAPNHRHPTLQKSMRELSERFL